MAANNNDSRDKLLDDKKNLIVNKSGTGKKWIIAGAVFVIAVMVSAGIWFGLKTGDRPESSVQVNAVTTGVEATSGGVTADAAVYDKEMFRDGKAHFFKYGYNGTVIKYFILVGPDGEVRSAFDACDVCWRAGKGYTRRGDVMVCNNCGREFPSAMIGKVSGGCNPAPLENKVNDGKIVIKNSDVIKGLTYFRDVEGI